ncbi:CHITINASE-RELATED [Salix purpurea]|uniref:CHITINASE-RELATED n=1 Tax=Salix purpurea TaxID=77065 RepID=A0A9Q0P268_SALPP|nr:CHITINASE-RELATED [Salix purpurea]
MASSAYTFLSFIFFTIFLSFGSYKAEARRYSGISSLVSRGLFDSIFLHKDNIACPAKDFYTYSSFIQASRFFPQFGRTGSSIARKREVAAFLAQISHETTGGGPALRANPTKEEDLFNYHGITITDRQARPLGFDGLNSPDIVSNNSLIAFKTALWFWMTAQSPKPSCHNVMIGKYKPTAADVKANRTAGYGLVTNIINGGLECGIPNDGRVSDRIGFFQRYATLFNVSTGSNLDCENQKPFS